MGRIPTGRGYTSLLADMVVVYSKGRPMLLMVTQGELYTRERRPHAPSAEQLEDIMANGARSNLRCTGINGKVTLP